MKLKKILVCILAGLMCQGTAAFASSDDDITNEDVQNMTPGWNNSDKKINDYKLTNTNNMYSLNGSNDIYADDNSNKDDNDESYDNETVFDQIIGEDNSTETTQQVGSIAYTIPSTGARNSYWGQSSNGQWMLIENGSPAVGWKYVGGHWYYMNTYGVMQTGWINDKNRWYYLYSNGQMAYNTWVGNFYLGSDGAMR